jgi:hypothetical protein
MKLYILCPENEYEEDPMSDYNYHRQVSTCHTDRRKIEKDDRMVDILAVLAGGGGRIQFFKMILFLCFLLFVYFSTFFRCPIVQSWALSPLFSL